MFQTVMSSRVASSSSSDDEDRDRSTSASCSPRREEEAPKRNRSGVKPSSSSSLIDSALAAAARLRRMAERGSEGAGKRRSVDPALVRKIVNFLGGNVIENFCSLLKWPKLCV